MRATPLIVRVSRGPRYTVQVGRFSEGGGAKAPPSSCPAKTGPEGAVQGPCLRRPLRYEIVDNLLIIVHLLFIFKCAHLVRIVSHRVYCSRMAPTRGVMGRDS